MEIIAKTDNGFLINGTESELKEIIRAVQGAVPKEIKIGQWIPAIDYSATITKIKRLPEEYFYRQLIKHAKEFDMFINKLQMVVEDSTKLQQQP